MNSMNYKKKTSIDNYSMLAALGTAHAQLRGTAIKYREYISVGKGRDMGFDSINAFEIKTSGESEGGSGQPCVGVQGGRLRVQGGAGV